jgi:hypothetical protein
MKVMAAYPTMSLAAPLREGFCIALTSILFSLSVGGIESEYIKRSLVRNVLFVSGVSRWKRGFGTATARERLRGGLIDRPLAYARGTVKI